MDDPRTALLRLRTETVDPILDSSKGEGATTSPHSKPSVYARQDPQTNDPRSTDNPHEGGGTAGQGQDHHLPSRNPLQMSTFNGWANHATWNVALWIGNEESLNVLARRISKGGGTYKDLAEVLVHTFGKTKTPDGVSFTDPALDLDALNECVADL